MPEKRTDKPAPHPEPEPPETIDKPAELQAEAGIPVRVGEEETPEGDTGDYPRVRFDAERRQQYHVPPGSNKRVYHDTPEGYSFDADGNLKPKQSRK
jgi:hypothetical protein